MKCNVMLCYVYVMSCHVMSCYVMSCYVMSCYVMSCYVMICHVMSCHVMLCHDMSCYVMLCHVMSCHVMSCYVMLCYIMLCYVMLCYVMLCYVMLCYVMLFEDECHTVIGLCIRELWVNESQVDITHFCNVNTFNQQYFSPACLGHRHFICLFLCCSFYDTSLARTPNRRLIGGLMNGELGLIRKGAVVTSVVGRMSKSWTPGSHCD